MHFDTQGLYDFVYGERNKFHTGKTIGNRFRKNRNMIYNGTPLLKLWKNIYGGKLNGLRNNRHDSHRLVEFSKEDENSHRTYALDIYNEIKEDINMCYNVR